MRKVLLVIALILLFIVVVPAISPSLSVTTDKDAYRPGEKVTITVSGAPGTVVGIQVLRPDGITTEFVDQITIGDNGKASTSFRLPDDNLGTWKVVATGGGEKAEKTFRVKGSSRITISLNKDFISLGDSVTISGSINPAVTTTVTIEYRREGGSWNTLAEVNARNGRYSYTWTPSSEGKYYLRASWPGNDRYFGATSSTVSLTVSRKQRSSISIEISSSEITLGQNITVSGYLNPPLAGASIEIIYTTPEGDRITRTVTTNANGRFSDTFYPDISGTWSVKAVWYGNENYFGSSSSVINFMVKGVINISIYLSPNILRVGEYTIIYVYTSPAVADTKVFFEYSLDKVNWSIIGSSFTDRNGAAAFLWTLNATGKYFVRARIPAGAEYVESISNILNISVRKELKSIEEYERLLNKTTALLSDYEKKMKEYNSTIEIMRSNITNLFNQLSALKDELNNTKTLLDQAKAELTESRETINSLRSMLYVSGIVGLISGFIAGTIVTMIVMKRREKKKIHE